MNAFDRFHFCRNANRNGPVSNAVHHCGSSLFQFVSFACESQLLNLKWSLGICGISKIADERRSWFSCPTRRYQCCWFQAYQNCRVQNTLAHRPRLSSRLCFDIGVGCCELNIHKSQTLASTGSIILTQYYWLNTGWRVFYPRSVMQFFRIVNYLESLN